MDSGHRIHHLLVIAALAVAAMLALPAVGMAQEIHLEVTASEVDVVGSADVTYTYRVSNTTTQTPITNVTLTDDTFSPAYVSGDDGDDILDPGEVWIYAVTALITQTTTNNATVTGLLDNELEVSASDSVTVTVVTEAEPEPEPEPEAEAETAETVTGGEIPDTATPWYNILFVGTALALIGAAGLVVVSRRSHA